MNTLLKLIYILKYSYFLRAFDIIIRYFRANMYFQLHVCSTCIFSYMYGRHVFSVTCICSTCIFSYMYFQANMYFQLYMKYARTWFDFPLYACLNSRFMAIRTLFERKTHRVSQRSICKYHCIFTLTVPWPNHCMKVRDT